MATSISEIQDILRDLYKPSSIFQKILIQGRPLICPFHVLVSLVPARATVLDVGCGSGVFLNLLASLRQTSGSLGIDTSPSAIELARGASRASAEKEGPVFECRTAESGLPGGVYDVVSMIDVAHHVEPAQQRNIIQEAAGMVAPGGRFLYKDIGSRPLWRAWANRLHDLVLTREWIHYIEVRDVMAWLDEAGLELVNRQTINMLWYGHELLVYRRPEQVDDSVPS